MNQTIQRLSDLCLKHRFEGKVFFTYSFRVGQQICEHLAKEGTSWINLKISTPTTFPQKLAEHLLVEKGNGDEEFDGEFDDGLEYEESHFKS